MTEHYFEAKLFSPEGERAADRGQRSRVLSGASLPPEKVPGLAGLDRVNAFSAGSKLPYLVDRSTKRGLGCRTPGQR